MPVRNRFDRPATRERTLLVLVIGIALLSLSVAAADGSGEARPNLVVTDLQVTDGSDGHVTVVTIKNTGSADAPYVAIDVVSDKDGARMQQFPNALSKGDSQEYSIAWGHGLYGAHTFSATVDPNDAIAETDESDNRLERSLALGTAELRLSAVDVPDGPLIRHAPAEIRVHLANDGTATAYGIEFGGYSQTIDVFRNARSLSPGYETTTTIGWWLPTGTQDTLTITVDPDQRIPQERRSDDRLQVTRQVVDPTPLEIDPLFQIGEATELQPDTYHIDLYLEFRGDHVAPRTDVYLRDGGEDVKSWSVGAVPNGRAGEDLVSQWNEQDGAFRQTLPLRYFHQILDGHLPRYTVEVVTDPGTDWSRSMSIVDEHPPHLRPIGYHYVAFDGRLDGERYTLPDPECAPDEAEGHVRTGTSQGTSYALLPRSGCGIGFGQGNFRDRNNTFVYFPESIYFDGFRARIDGSERTHEGVLRVYVDGQAVAKGTYSMRPSDGFQSFAFEDPLVVPDGRRAVRVAFEATRGPTVSDFALDWISSRPAEPTQNSEGGSGGGGGGAASSPTPSPSGGGPSPSPTPSPSGGSATPTPTLSSTVGQDGTSDGDAQEDPPRPAPAPTASPWWTAGPRQGVYAARPMDLESPSGYVLVQARLVLTNPDGTDALVDVEWRVGDSVETSRVIGISERVHVAAAGEAEVRSPEIEVSEGTLYAVVADAGNLSVASSVHGTAFDAIGEGSFGTEAQSSADGAVRRHLVVLTAGVGSLTLLAGGIWTWVNEARRYDLLRWLLRSGIGVGLFSRIQGAKTLEHETREEIHRLVSERPGVHYREILRTLRLSNGRLAHHLQTLEREGVLRSQRDGRLVRFFAARATSRIGEPLTPRQAAILTHVRRRPGILQSDLAKELGVSRQALHQQVSALREAGLMIASASGRTNALYLESDIDRRICRCTACDTRYDRGVESLEEILCPSCGTV